MNTAAYLPSMEVRGVLDKVRRLVLGDRANANATVGWFWWKGDSDVLNLVY